jgi:thymidylate synthase (FAD)
MNYLTGADARHAAAQHEDRTFRKVLDHGFVRLVDSMGSDLSVARAARVSYDAAWRAGEDAGSDAKLIRYLWKNHHTTPFEAVTFTFEVKAPIFVFRQWHRHRTWSFNELSARYRELPEEFYVPALDVIAKQSTDNKQGRSDEVVSQQWASTQVGKIQEACAAAFDTYKDMLAMGVARELARSVLPVATYSHMFATVDLLNLLKFLTLRCDGHAQYEIRVYADAMRELACTVAPVCMAAWEAKTS